MEPREQYFHYLKFLVPVEAIARISTVAPKPYASAEVRAWRSVAVLDGLSTDEYSRDGLAGEKYFTAALMTICEEYEAHAGLIPGSVSPKLMGTVMRGLGLTLIRRKDGYKVLWTKQQLSILAEYVMEE